MASARRLRLEPQSASLSLRQPRLRLPYETKREAKSCKTKTPRQAASNSRRVPPTPVRVAPVRPRPWAIASRLRRYILYRFSSIFITSQHSQPPFTGAIPWAAATWQQQQPPMWQQQQQPPMWQQQQQPMWQQQQPPMRQQQQQPPQTPYQQQRQPHQQEDSPPGSVRAVKKQIRGLLAAQAIPGQQPADLAARAQQIDGLQTDLEERERKFRKHGHW